MGNMVEAEEVSPYLDPSYIDRTLVRYFDNLYDSKSIPRTIRYSDVVGVTIYHGTLFLDNFHYLGNRNYRATYNGRLFPDGNVSVSNYLSIQ